MQSTTAISQLLRTRPYGRTSTFQHKVTDIVIKTFHHITRSPQPTTVLNPEYQNIFFLRRENFNQRQDSMSQK